jgi:pimeloyl-ACP methyl ester carboxylesterase
MLDRRGMGASDPVPLEALPSWEEFADDASAVLDAVGSERTVLLGANDAGPTAVLFAAARPVRTYSLILFNSTAAFPEGADDAPRIMKDEEWDAIRVFLQENWGPEEAVANASSDQAPDPGFLRWQAKNIRVSCSPRQAAAYMRQASSMDIRHVLPAVAVPTLVIHRQKPPRYTPLDTGRYLAEHIAGARVLVVPGKALNI